MWVVFEGLDKSGKTTLEWSFLKRTDYKHQVVDRGPAGYMAFDRIFGRSTAEGDTEFMRQAMKMNMDPDVLVVYCHCSADVAMSRLQEYGEDCPYDYSEADSLLYKYVNMMYESNKMVMIDTTSISVEEATEKIVDKLIDMIVLSHEQKIVSLMDKGMSRD